MVKDKFVLLNLNEAKTKNLAQAISNPSCTKILSYLADKEHATESEIAKELNIPLSTVHYNLQQLTASNLVRIEEFHYSKKGREVNHYVLTHQYIIITPTASYNIKQRLKSLLAIGLVTIGGGALFQLYHKTRLPPQPEFAALAADTAAKSSATIAPAATFSPLTWFIAGVLVIITLTIIVEAVMYKRSRSGGTL